jgi:hypothetical protein
MCAFLPRAALAAEVEQTRISHISGGLLPARPPKLITTLHGIGHAREGTADHPLPLLTQKKLSQKTPKDVP